MCWAERADQPGYILLTGWNHMSAWMQFAKRLMLPSSKERVSWSYSLHGLKLRTTNWSGLFCSGRRRMCCLYTSQAKQSHVICPKYPVTYTWSLSHPHVTAREPAGISQSHECTGTKRIVSSERKRMAAAVLWTVDNLAVGCLRGFVLVSVPALWKGCEEQVA